MPTNFPFGVDSFNNPTSADDMNTPGVIHHEQHTNANDAIEAMERMLVGPAWINVKSFGAVGNGVTDDRNAIQAAFDSGQNGSIFFPPGTYNILNGSLAVRSNTRIMGCGRASTLHDGTGNRSILGLNDVENVHIEGLRFTGTGNLGTPGRAAIWCAISSSFGARYSTFVHNIIDGVGTCGIVLDNSKDCLVHHNYIFNTKEHGVYVATNSDRCTVSENVIINAGLSSTSTNVDGVKAIGNRNKIIGNTILEPLHEAIVFESTAVDCEARSNTCIDAGSRGIRVIAGASGISIDSNMVIGSASTGILIAASVTDFDIIANVVRTSGAWAVEVAPGTSNHYIIVNNRGRGNTSGGLLDGGTGAQKTVSPNQLFS